jgi:hypothetical protein
MGKKTFNARITEKGFGSTRGGHNKPIWRGLRLLTAEEKEKGTTNSTNDTLFTQSSFHEEIIAKVCEKPATKVVKVTLPDVKSPKRLNTIDFCSDCGSENIGFWDDGAAGYNFCLSCFPQFYVPEVGGENDDQNR